MVVKDWAKYTVEEADAILLDIFRKNNENIFEEFCIKDVETRTGINDGVISQEKAIKMGRLMNEELSSFYNAETAKKYVNKIFAEQHLKVAEWAVKGCRGPLHLYGDSDNPLGVTYHFDGTISPTTRGGVTFVRDVTRNPDGYGFTASPHVYKK